MSTKKYDINNTLLPYIGRTHHLLRLYLKDSFKKAKISLTREQLIVLISLHEQDDINQNELALLTKRNKTTLTRLLNNLEKKNLVKREQAKTDKRINKIYITAEGKEILERTFPIIEHTSKLLEQDLTIDEINSIKSITEKIQFKITELLNIK